MLKSNSIRLSVAVLLTASVACALPAVSTPDTNAIGTTVARTIVAGLTQTALPIIPITGLESPTATQTFTPTVTPSPTFSPTPIFTSTSLVPLITVSVPTNCRVGPGRIYDRVGALLVGEVAEVVGRDPTGNYWYIRNPDAGPEFCWLWGEYATLVGNLTILPVFTPPPTPTPTASFKASFDGLDTCVGWWVDIKLENNGGVAFRSLSLTIRDTDTDTVLSNISDTFTNVNGCVTTNSRDALVPGATFTISSPSFAYNPTGHKIRATITLCSGNQQNGMCTSRVINFTP